MTPEGPPFPLFSREHQGQDCPPPHDHGAWRTNGVVIDLL